jgi:hypothetical protein
MTHFLSPRVIYSVLFYVMLSSLVYMTKPLLAFDVHGHIKPFGIGNGKTVFSLGAIVSCLSIVCFYVFCLIDMLS